MDLILLEREEGRNTERDGESLLLGENMGGYFCVCADIFVNLQY